MANEGSVERWAVKVSGGVAFYCEARILPRGKRRGNLCIMEKGSANFRGKRASITPQPPLMQRIDHTAHKE